MIQSLISLLKSKEVQIIITHALKLAASPDVTKLVKGITKCTKSIFYIIKTPEIQEFQTQILQLIEDENQKQNENQATNTKIPGEGHHSEDENDEEQESKNDNTETPHTPKKTASKTTNSGYSYSPYKAWNGLTSMFGGYDEESDVLDDGTE